MLVAVAAQDYPDDCYDALIHEIDLTPAEYCNRLGSDDVLERSYLAECVERAVVRLLTKDAP